MVARYHANLVWQSADGLFIGRNGRSNSILLYIILL